MLDAISATQIGMLQDQLRLQFVSQNITNMQTLGYKRQLIESNGFDEQIHPNLSTVSTQMQQRIQSSQGSFVQSQRLNELALAGDGYFEVQTYEGIFYTRRGDCHVNEQGELVTATGARLLGKGGTLHVDDNTFTIDTNGALFIDGRQIDQINIVQFNHQEQMKYKGQGLYESQEIPHSADNSVHVLQGSLEQSNVKSLDEMMEMVRISRHFEASQRVMRTADRLLSTAINQLGEGNV